MSSTAQLERAIAVGKGVLSGVTGDQMGSPTPCASWTVGQLVNHLIGANSFFVAMLAGTQPGGDGAGRDYSAGDYRTAFEQATAAALAEFREPGALEKTISLPWGPTPGAVLCRLAATDIFQHSWDLARATGQSTDLDPELASQLLESAKETLSDALRGPDGGPNQDQGPPFGPEQPAPTGARPADELAAFLGRVVG